MYTIAVPVHGTHLSGCYACLQFSLKVLQMEGVHNRLC